MSRQHPPKPVSYLGSLMLFMGIAILSLAACGPKPDDTAYLNRGGPESLIDVSAEVITLNAATVSDLAELKKWIIKDRPSRAELSCDTQNKTCRDTAALLKKHKVPTTSGYEGNGTVTLVYDRLVARDCDSAYVNNTHNHYNTNHASFGCAIASNMVRQITDKREIVSPALSSDPSAIPATDVIRRAYAPRDKIKPYNIDESIVSKSKSTN